MLSNCEINSLLQALGNGLLGKIKYDFRFSYEPFKLFKNKFQKKQLTIKKVNHNLYKKIK